VIKSTVYLDPETVATLRQLSRAQGRSQAELIREAVAQYTLTAERPLPKGFGKYRSGRDDISERAEEILRERARRQ